MSDETDNGERLHNDLTMGEFLELCRTLALVATYTPEAWERAVCEMSEEYEEADDE